MEKRNGPMKKTIVSLMFDNICRQSIDLDEMIKNNQENAIEFIHNQYLEASHQLNDLKYKSQS